MSDILEHYQLSEATCIKRTCFKLDQLRLITLLPGNRIRLNISRDFDWIPGGPIRTYFREVACPIFERASTTKEKPSVSPTAC